MQIRLSCFLPIYTKLMTTNYPVMVAQGESSTPSISTQIIPTEVTMSAMQGQGTNSTPTIAK